MIGRPYPMDRVRAGIAAVPERFDVLVVASGHNDVPKLPDPAYPGTFAGRQLHALESPGGEPFRVSLNTTEHRNALSRPGILRLADH